MPHGKGVFFMIQCTLVRFYLLASAKFRFYNYPFIEYLTGLIKFVLK